MSRVVILNSSPGLSKHHRPTSKRHEKASHSHFCWTDEATKPWALANPTIKSQMATGKGGLNLVCLFSSQTFYVRPRDCQLITKARHHMLASKNGMFY